MFYQSFACCKIDAQAFTFPDSPYVDDCFYVVSIVHTRMKIDFNIFYLITGKFLQLTYIVDLDVIYINQGCSSAKDRDTFRCTADKRHHGQNLNGISCSCQQGVLHIDLHFPSIHLNDRTFPGHYHFIQLLCLFNEYNGSHIYTRSQIYVFVAKTAYLDKTVIQRQFLRIRQQKMPIINCYCS